MSPVLDVLRRIDESFAARSSRDSRGTQPEFYAQGSSGSRQRPGVDEQVINLYLLAAVQADLYTMADGIDKRADGIIREAFL